MANKRILVKSLIEDDLGYCCEYAFFSLFKSTAQIAARLGVTTRAVKIHKAAVRSGCEKCQLKPNCLELRMKPLERKQQ